MDGGGRARPPKGAPKPGRLRTRAEGACFAVFAILGLGVLLAPAAALPCALPAAAIVLAAVVFYAALSVRSGGAMPLLELGGIYVGVVALYALWPLGKYVALGMDYTAAGGPARLVQADPTPAEMGAIAWRYAAFLAAFAAVYVLARRRGPASPARPAAPDRATLVTLAALFVAVKGCFLVLHAVYGMEAETYIETYVAARRLPPLAAQVYGKLSGVLFVVEIALLVVLFLRYRRYRWVIGAAVALVVVASFAAMGSRTEMVVVLFAAVIAYHRLVRPLRFGRLAAAGAVGLGLFLALGALRETGRAAVRPLERSSEFETVFANAYDLHRRRAGGEIGQLPAAFYLHDLLALVPRQLSSVEKVAPSRWYLERFYPEYGEAGGGLAFGVVSEAIVGLGWLGLVLRGAALGLIMGRVQWHLATGPQRLWRWVFYVWLCVMCYRMFRGTTLALLTPISYQFLPVLVAFAVGRRILRRLLGARAGAPAQVPNPDAPGLGPSLGESPARSRRS
jgi:hypothetical protein